MSLYIDSSALVKRYVAEADSAECDRILRAGPSWITGRHTWVEVSRTLARLVQDTELDRILQAFERDWRRTHVVELDEATCNLAAETARIQGVRTLDALHLAAAMHVGGTTFPFFTYDLRQAQAARALGLNVLGS